MKQLRVAWIALGVLGAVATGATGAALVVGLGFYDVAASTQHTQPVFSFLKAVMRQSVRFHARNVEMPEAALDPQQVARRFEATGSLIETIEGLRGGGRSLELLDLVPPGPMDEFIAENELLDPTSPDAMFESLTERGLRKSWHRGRDWMRRHRPFGRKR